MRILVVVPRFVQNFGDFYHFPLGLSYIASALTQAGHHVLGLNLNHGHDVPERIVECEMQKHSIDVCATGGLSPFLPQIKKIFAGARRAGAKIINIAGGGVVSSDPEVSLQIMDIDIGIVGEGETTICEVLAAIQTGRDLRAVSGIVYRDRTGEVVRTPNRESVMDLRQIARPDYEILGYQKHLEFQRPLDHHFFQTQPENNPRSIDMITSRSCPYSCTFCFHPVGKVYRERPLDDFFSELKTLIERYQVNMVSVLDELFSLRKARLLEFCERIRPLNVQWMVQLHVHSADDEVLDAMRAAGCSYISYGIESMNEDVLRSMQKKTKPVRVNATLERTYARKIGIQGNLLFGDSAETLETANETMHWWAKNRRYQVYLSRVQVYPGSPDYIMSIRDGLITDRARYAEELPVYLNISRMNDVNFDALSFQADIHGRTLLNVAPVTKFAPSWKQLAGRGMAYDILWTCPRCSHVNCYNRCVLRPDHGKSIRVFCRSCRSRWDIQNFAAYASEQGRRPVSLDEETHAAEHSTKADIRSYLAQLALWARRSLRAPRNKTYQYQREQDPVLELRRAGLDLADEPFDATRHVRFGDALVHLGAFGAARLHLDQAASLEPDWPVPRARLDSLKQQDGCSDGSDIYFVSLSDDPGPCRRSREAAGFKSKNEPAFPVFSRAANRASVAEFPTDAASE